MTFAADNPGIPIRLTAIAAQDDMGVRAWILGQDRAIPTNYLHVHINEALINWFNGGFNYDEVVTAAADEADGQAFVTDYAGPSKIMENRIIWDRRFDGVDRLRTVEEPNRFISGLLEAGLPRDQQMQALLRRHIPIPPAVMSEGVLRIVFRGDEAAFNEAVAAGLLLQIAESSFYNNIDAYSEYTGDLEFDPNSFIDDVEEIIINPLREAQQLFEDYPYLTRLYTTLSPEEMTVDPMFSFNPDLPEISNMRTAHGRWECTLNGEELPFEEWVLVVTLKDGREIRSTPFSDIGPQPLPIGPAAVLIEQLDESGPPETVRRATFAAGSNQGELPEDFTLAENYPNPFNSGTVLPFKVPAAAAGQKVSLRVYNLLGQPIRTLVQHPLSPGPYEIAWDGLTEAGEAAPSGTYFYRLKTGSMQLTRKLMLLR